MNARSNRDAAVALAVSRIEEELRALGTAELAARCEQHGLGQVQDNTVALGFLDRRFALRLDDLACNPEPDPLSRALVLRCLTRKAPVCAAGNENSAALAYRELPGAAFYVQPFRSRTVLPLAMKVGDDQAQLRQVLQHYDACPLHEGHKADAAWRIPVLGQVWLELQYSAPDDEFPAVCELLFAPAVADIYTADEAAMLGSLLVWGIFSRWGA